MRGSTWTPLQLPIAAGLNQKSDDRALQAPELAAAVDVQFDELGGLQTRKPYSLLGSTVAGGGTISTARRLYANGNELVLMTKDGIYSWNSDASRWVFRATHLAISTEERTVHATPGDQYDCDRAELSGIVFHSWTDTDKVYLAAIDKVSGAVLLAPTAVTGPSAGTATRPRLVACSTHVLLFFHAGTDASPSHIHVMSFDPAQTDPATWSTTLSGSGVTVLAGASSGAYYDVTRILGTNTVAFAARRATTTSYEVAIVTAAQPATVSATTKARTCDGPIAVASHPSGTHIQIARGNGTTLLGDYLSVAGPLTDVTTGQALGTIPGGLAFSQVTAAYRSVTDGGAYRCYVWWSSNETSGSTNWQSKYNYVDTAGTIGTQAALAFRIGIASRAFDHDGRVFVWGVFAGESSFGGAGPGAFRAQLQNTFFLYRDDAGIHAKAVAQRGGGLAPSIGCLPGIALTSGSTVYSWCATERRIVPVGSGGSQTSFGKRAPRDVTFTFDSNDARRCVKLGETLYVSGAEILQYDGVGLYEVGFHIYPWYFVAGSSGAGNVPDGTYTYKCTWAWENARGELDRSTTATHGNLTIAAGPKIVSIDITPLNATRKLTARPIAVEVWRTAVNPTDGAPFYLCTAQDPADTSNPNRYIENAPTSHLTSQLQDDFTDAVLTTKETNDENGDVLENLAPPGATVIAATDTRIFLGNVAGDPDRIWYSKQRQDGRVAAFHDALTFDVPKDTGSGEITGIAFQNGICVVFREYATYMFPGDGFDNTGRGVNYGPAQIVSHDVGCRDTDSIASTPEGIVFQSSKGKYLLTRGWTMKPIGLPVADYDSETVLATHVMTAQHQVRFVTASRVLVWDYLAPSPSGLGTWAEWSITSAVHAGMWQGTYHYLAAAGPYAEQTTYSGTAYGWDVTTAWIKPNDLQGQISVRKLQALGEYKSACYVRCRVAYDYNPAWVDDTVWTPPSGIVDTEPATVVIRSSRRKVESIKTRLTVVGTPTQATLATAAAAIPVRHSGVPNTWTATLTVRSTPRTLGTLGNDQITLSIGGVITAGATSTITVKDGYYWETATSEWVKYGDRVGIKVEVATSGTTVLVSDIEAAISADSELLSVTTAHATAGATFTVADLSGSTINTAYGPSGGAFANPSGESLKLTGLAMEVGVEPKIFRRFAR